MDGTALTKASKRYLTDVGLPQWEGWLIRFNGRTKTLPEPPGRPGHRTIGIDVDRSPICIVESQEDRVVEVREDSEIFFNTSVVHFGACLYVIARIVRQRTRDDQGEVEATELEAQVRKIDPACYADPAMLWPGMVDQLDCGLI